MRYLINLEQLQIIIFWMIFLFSLKHQKQYILYTRIENLQKQYLPANYFCYLVAEKTDCI